MSELKKGFYLVTANGINTMLRWDGEDWVDMRGIRPCFKEVVQTRYCGENNPVFERDEPVAVVTGVYGGRFIVEPTNSAMVLPVNMALYAQPQPKAEKQEPVAWMTIDSNGEEDDIWYDNPEGKLLEGWSCKPLYTTPQPRKPLTNEQKKSIARRAFKDICKDYPVEDRIIKVIENIEEYHGIKE